MKIAKGKKQKKSVMNYFAHTQFRFCRRNANYERKEGLITFGEVYFLLFYVGRSKNQKQIMIMGDGGPYNRTRPLRPRGAMG